MWFSSKRSREGHIICVPADLRLPIGQTLEWTEMEKETAIDMLDNFDIMSSYAHIHADQCDPSPLSSCFSRNIFFPRRSESITARALVPATMGTSPSACAQLILAPWGTSSQYSALCRVVFVRYFSCFILLPHCYGGS